MTVEVRKDSVGQMVNLGGGFQVPSIDTRNVTTQIAVNNGDTAVIGGIYEEDITNSVDKVPFLGDIPFLGYLFKTTGRTSDEAGTPHLPHAARDQGFDQRDQVTVRRGEPCVGGQAPERRRPPDRLQCAGASASGQSVSGRAAGRGQIDARTPARAAAWQDVRRRRCRARAQARRDDPDDLRDRGRSELSRPRGGRAGRAHDAVEHRARHRRRRRHPAREPRAAEARTAPWSICTRCRKRCASARAGAGIGRCSTRRIRSRGWPSSTRCAIRSTGKSPTIVVESNRDEIAHFSRQLEAALHRPAAGMTVMQTQHVALGERSYAIHVGPGLLRDAGALLAPLLPRPRVVIVTNPVVAAHWLAPLRASLSAAGIDSESILVPDGETHKSWSTLHDVLTRLLEHPRGALDDARGAGRRRRRRHRRFRGGHLPARDAVRAGADHAARAGGFVGRRQDRRQPPARQEHDRSVPSAACRA